MEYCKQHREFTIRIIELAMNSSIEELERDGLKEVAYIATELSLIHI